ncbi:MAG: hypothetical protein ACRDVM_01335 [Acidimicrobiia bacterium]
MDASIIIALLVIAAAWGAFLFPSLFGSRRDAPLNSTEEFDRWTNVMADVQRRPFNVRRAQTRGVVRARRRRTIGALVVLAVATMVLAFALKSFDWLLIHIGIDAVIAWYIAMLAQIRQRSTARVARHSAADRVANREESQDRIVAH